MLFITHDLGLAREYCDRIAVMHAGHLVEVGATRQIFASPRHPYTSRLIAATPLDAQSLADLSAIEGNLPDLRRDNLPACRFAERCARRSNDCSGVLTLRPCGVGEHQVACHHPLPEAEIPEPESRYAATT
jgi:peptide/nickel transport system ATP-binding protein